MIDQGGIVWYSWDVMGQGLKAPFVACRNYTSGEKLIPELFSLFNYQHSRI